MSFLLNPFVFAGAAGDFESIATVTVGSGGAANIEFTSIPGTYQHLQVRMLASGARADGNPGWWGVDVEPNGDTGNNGTLHRIFGNGSTVGANGFTSRKVGFATVNGYSSDSTTLAASVVDILDYADTSKNTTFRCITGADRNGAGHVSIRSSLWLNTSAITSLKIIPDPGLTGFRNYSTAALYGIKA